MFAYLRQHPMLVEAPVGELRQPADDPVAVGMEDVRSVIMDHDPVRIDAVIGIACDMGATVDDMHRQPGIGGLAGNDAAGKACANDQDVGAAKRVDGFGVHHILTFPENGPRPVARSAATIANVTPISTAIFAIAAPIAP